MSAASRRSDYSLRNFPPDILAALGLPVAVVAIIFSSLLSPHGTLWIWAATISFGTGVVGAVLLFIAKLPLYRERRFFTFGIQALPESSHGFYRWGCRCSIVGCVLMLLLWLSSKIWA